MKLSKNKLALAIVGAAAIGVAGLSGAGIKGSMHDLGAATAANDTAQITGAATTEICVFCHTPHGASDSTVPVPLWNKALPAAGGFTTYDQLGTSSLDGAVASVGSVSLACLSCHDGVSAMDNMINQPGRGLWNANGANNGSGVAMAGSPIPAVSKDTASLKNDHPIGIQYCGGGIVVGSGTCVDGDFKAPTEKVLDNMSIWWVEDITADGNRQKTEMQLYTRDEAGITGGPQPFVECASCHDPHQGDQAVSKTFLRIDNDGSAVCLACHVK